MTCEHCCFACGKRGSFMSLETFKAALKVAVDYGGCIAIGGGEPTLHPDFEKFLLLAISESGDDGRPFIVTNGSIKERAMMIAKLTKAGVIEGKLSWDQYHDLDMVDSEVFEAFSEEKNLWGPSYGTTTPYRNPAGVIKAGRARKIKEAREKDCCCTDIFVKPNGNIHHCGCKNSPKIGHVTTGITEEIEGDCANGY